MNQTTTAHEQAPRTQNNPIVPSKRSLLPKGLWGMALTEMWERFSFYGVQAILAFYLLYSLDKGGLNLGPAVATGIVGAYGGAVYLAQVLGAWLGDRLFAPKHLVFWGGLIITLGHVALAVVPGLMGVGIGLIMIVLGTGALKTNITSIVGFLVEGKPQQERDVSFSYFYMAINFGAVLGPALTGLVQSELGFHWGFGLAAVGMATALVQYVLSMKKLPERASQVVNPLPSTHYVRVVLIVVAALLLIVIAAIVGILRIENLASVMATVSLVAAAAYFITMLASRKVTSDERRRVAGYLPLFVLSGLYFGLLFQEFTAISVLIDERVDLTIAGWQFPVAWVVTMSALAAVVFTPLIAKVWTSLGDRQPSSSTKIAIGLLQIGVAYLFLMIVSKSTGDAMIPLVLILLFMIVAGSSEIFVGPIGLSVATSIGPKAFKSQMVGLNFLTFALGASISGLLGQLFTMMETTQYFLVIAASGFVLGAVLMVVRKPMTNLMRAGL